MLQKSLNSLKSYQALCTEFYDLTKPQACEKEVLFYSKLIEQTNGPILEAMCGSGRLLIPLLQKGYTIDGVDLSPSMLEQCAQRCRSQNLTVNLFQQALQDLQLPSSYALIYIPVGSFQLINNRVEALRILKKLYRHLQPGGKLILDTSIPWDSIKECIDKDRLINQPKILTFSRQAHISSEVTLHLHIQVTIDPQQQLEIYENRYEKKEGEKIIAREEEELFIRWYYPFEMQLFLEKAGFSNVQICEESFEHNANAVIYEAMKK
jgi:SAM-dependent methyltransferase